MKIEIITSLKKENKGIGELLKLIVKKEKQPPKATVFSGCGGRILFSPRKIFDFPGTPVDLLGGSNPAK